MDVYAMGKEDIFSLDRYLFWKAFWRDLKYTQHFLKVLIGIQGEYLQTSW